MAQQPGEKKDMMAFAVMGALTVFIFAMMAQKPIAWLIIQTSIPLFKFFSWAFNDHIARSSLTWIGINITKFEDLEKFSYGDMYAFMKINGEYFRWVVLLPLFLWGAKIATTSHVSNLMRRMNFQKLVIEKAYMFPTIRPVVGLDLLSDRFNHKKSAWRVAENPIEMCLRLNAIEYDGKPLTEKTVALRYEIEGQYKLDRAKFISENIENEFKSHLGRRIYASLVDVQNIGKKSDIKESRNEVIDVLIKNFSPHERALIALFLMRFIGRTAYTQKSYDLIEQFASSFWVDRDTYKLPNWKKALVRFKRLINHNAQFKHVFNEKALNISGVDGFIGKIILECDEVKFELLCIEMRKTAWSNILIMHLLDVARTYGGVLITADFIWLRPMNRKLWYVLNSLGRKTPLVEGAGAYAHAATESMMERPLLAEDVSEAVSAMNGILIKEGWIPE